MALTARTPEDNLTDLVESSEFANVRLTALATKTDHIAAKVDEIAGDVGLIAGVVRFAIWMMVLQIILLGIGSVVALLSTFGTK
jgi:hypothetical protein